MRLFVALDIPDELRRAVADAVAPLKSIVPQARWARPESWHLTLKFIGEFPEAKLGELKQALERAGEEMRQCSAPPVALEFRGAHFFPSRSQPRVFAVASADSPGATPIAELARSVEEPLAALKIPKEERSFRAHLTLARFDPPLRKGPALDALLAEAARLDAAPLGKMRAVEFDLYRSQLGRGGALYTKLESFVFAARQAHSEAAS